MRYHFYAWRGGPKFWVSTVPEPREPEFLIAFAESVKSRKSVVYMTPQMVDDFLDSTAMPRGERTKADDRKWALRFAADFADDPAAIWEDPRSRGELNEWRAKWKDSPKQHDYAGTVAVRILNWARDEGKITAHYCDRLHRILDRISDPSLRLQDTRGTAARRLLRAGLGLNQIANHMGWSLRYAASVIEQYAAVSPAESAEVLDLLAQEKQRREAKIVNATVNTLAGAQKGES